MPPSSTQNVKNMYLRTCLKCKAPKEEPAFVGNREICRACYVYLPKEEKEAYTRNEKYMIARKKRLLRLKSMLSRN